uniref:Uncharacterized protein n=1 Tax=Plectus sambesii TaxID=2011161 RepID=A0A914WSI5_9BILA
MIRYAWFFRLTPITTLIRLFCRARLFSINAAAAFATFGGASSRLSLSIGPPYSSAWDIVPRRRATCWPYRVAAISGRPRFDLPITLVGANSCPLTPAVGYDHVGGRWAQARGVRDGKRTMRARESESEEERRAAAIQLLASLYQPYVQVARAVWAQAEATFDGSDGQLDAFLSAAVQLLVSLKQLANRPPAHVIVSPHALCTICRLRRQLDRAGLLWPRGERAVWRFVAADADAVDPRRRAASRARTTRHSVLSRVDDGLRDGPTPVCSSGSQTGRHQSSARHCLDAGPAYFGPHCLRLSLIYCLATTR